MLLKLTLDHKGIAELLKTTEFRSALHEIAEPVAAEIRSAQPDAEVELEDYTTDRAAVRVVVKDVRAAGWQARDGLVTRAAAAAGLEVRAR